MNKIKVLGLASLLVIGVSSCMSGEATKVNKTDSNTIDNKELVVEEKMDEAVDSSVTIDNFIMAAHDGKIDFVKNALDTGLNVDSKNPNGQTALMFAGFNGHLDIVKLLIENGADVATVDGINRNVLMYTSTGPFLETVKYLLDSGAKSVVNEVDAEQNWTAVMFASSEGHLDVVKLLVANGADVNMFDIDGDSAYHMAFANQHAETIAYLKGISKSEYVQEKK